ncbi:MAG: hypothetical protein HUU49_00800 [Candidatus Buchananbacteria bacterium]|nr:hypothetical protein [Candidatus Buchananbacteria bacterium]
MDTPAFVVHALSRVQCPQPPDTFFHDFLESRGKICTECSLFNSNQCSGLGRILVELFDPFTTIEALHNGNLELIVIFDFLCSCSELRKLSHHAIAAALTILCCNGSETPLSDEELLAHLRQKFYSETDETGIDRPQIGKNIRNIAEEIERILEVKMPSTTT